MKKTLIIFIVFFVAVLIAYSYCPGEKFQIIYECPETVSKELIVGMGENYTSIQQAVDAASPGDIITVNSGRYKGNIEINKKLTLKANNTVIINPGDENLPGFNVTADNVIISGFTISGFRNTYGIIFKDVNNCAISDNYVDSNMWGIVIYSSADCEVTNNIVNNHMQFYGREGEDSPPGLLVGIPSSGIEIIYSENILVEDNELLDNINGIELLDSNNNIVSSNRVELTDRVYESSRFNNGINYMGSYNTIKNNIVKNYEDCIDSVGASYNTIIDNRIFDCAAAIGFNHHSNYNNVSGNYIKHNDYGVLLWDDCSKNIIEKNTLIANSMGIAFYGNSDYNVVKQCSITENRDVGIYSENSNNNQIIDSLFETRREVNSTLEII